MTAAIPVEYLRQRYCYDPETGLFTWKERPLSDCSSALVYHNWEARFAGKQAFIRRNHCGYLTGEIAYGGRRFYFLAHRVAFAMVAGRFPYEEIDHVNGVRDDNRFANLREATRTQNNWNVRKPGRYLPGTYPSGSRWKAAICHDKKSLHLGTFDTELDAHAAYLGMSQKLRGDFAAIRSQPTGE